MAVIDVRPLVDSLSSTSGPLEATEATFTARASRIRTAPSSPAIIIPRTLTVELPPSSDPDDPQYLIHVPVQWRRLVLGDEGVDPLGQAQHQHFFSRLQ
jgi:hypothetical protein